MWEKVTNTISRYMLTKVSYFNKITKFGIMVSMMELNENLTFCGVPGSQ